HPAAGKPNLTVTFCDRPCSWPTHNTAGRRATAACQTGPNISRISAAREYWLWPTFREGKPGCQRRSRATGHTGALETRQIRVASRVADFGHDARAHQPARLAYP